MTYTGKKICKSKQEVNVLFRKLNNEGYKYGGGSDLLLDDNTCYFDTFPILLAFDARKKLVYFSRDVSKYNDVIINPSLR